MTTLSPAFRAQMQRWSAEAQDQAGGICAISRAVRDFCNALGLVRALPIPSADAVFETVKLTSPPAEIITHIVRKLIVWDCGNIAAPALCLFRGQSADHKQIAQSVFGKLTQEEQISVRENSSWDKP